MRRAATTIAPVIALALSAGTVHAQTAVAPQNMKAEDIAMSPLRDINVSKKDIPVVLEMAMAKPYDLSGIKSCKGLTTAIVDLDGALGDDIDVASGEKSDGEKMGNGAGAIAKTVINGFIPFRSIIREVSGANAQERLWDRALYAGSVRRAFLKGMGEQRGCAWPARSATPAVLAKLSAEREQQRLAKADKAKSEKTEGQPVAVNYDPASTAKPNGSKR